MNKAVSEYLNHACSPIKSKQQRLSARAELSGHIQTSVEELRQAGASEENAVQTALDRMGDPYEIGRQIASFNAPWQNRLALIAGTVLLITVFFCMSLFLNIFLFDLPSLIFVVLLTLAFVLIGGLSRLTRLSALARGRAAALYAGGIGMILGIVELLGNIGDPAVFGRGLSFCITSVLYGLITSAVLTSIAHLCRPLEGNEIRKILGWEDIDL